LESIKLAIRLSDTVTVSRMAFFGITVLQLLTCACVRPVDQMANMDGIATDTVRYKPVVLAIEGMTSRKCENIIQTAIAHIDGVQQVEASFEQEKADIIYNTSQTSMLQISEAIGQLGYQVKGEIQKNKD